MAIKRVSDSYANGIQAFAGARPRRPRPPPRPARQKPTAMAALMPSLEEALIAEAAMMTDSPTVETPIEKPAEKSIEKPVEKPFKAKPTAVEQIDARLDETTERAIADIAADIGKMRHSPKRNGDGLTQVDYHEIIANTVGTLTNSTAEARHAVYECARQVVYQRLSRIRPALPPDALERERIALDRAIQEIEAKTEGQRSTEKSQDSSNAAPTPDAIGPVVIPPQKRELPQAKHFHGIALRLFGVAAVLCLGLFGYWLAKDKPEFSSAVGYLKKTQGAPPAPENSESAAGVATETTATATDPLPQPLTELEQREVVTPRLEQTDIQPPIGFLAAARGALCANPPCDVVDESIPSWLPPSSPDSVRDTASARDPTRTPALAAYERGLAQTKGADPERAVREFTAAIRADPNFADAYVQRGNMLFKNGNVEKAIDDFRAAIRIDARNAAAYKARGMAVFYLGDEDRALDDLTQAIQIAEADPTRLSQLETFFARRTRAMMYSRRQMGDRELFDYVAMIDAYWKNPELADALKQNYGTQGSAALIAWIYRQRAGLYQQRANPDGAVADLSMALQLDPTHALAVLAERARIQEAAGKREQAAADLKRALAINPRFEEARRRLGQLGDTPAPSQQ
ncbi:MAG TPA: tetratricopeptide repeat protein [Xanthobacteraceae bacterium]|nr:tetratricopeptide repeat protein [Xanthobacteraceae bacterium]